MCGNIFSIRLSGICSHVLRSPPVGAGDGTRWGGGLGLPGGAKASSSMVPDTLT